MPNVFNGKKTIVTGGIVLLLFLVQIASFAGEEWHLKICTLSVLKMCL